MFKNHLWIDTEIFMGEMIDYLGSGWGIVETRLATTWSLLKLSDGMWGFTKLLLKLKIFHHTKLKKKHTHVLVSCYSIQKAKLLRIHKVRSQSNLDTWESKADTTKSFAVHGRVSLRTLASDDLLTRTSPFMEICYFPACLKTPPSTFSFPFVCKLTFSHGQRELLFQ